MNMPSMLAAPAAAKGVLDAIHIQRVHLQGLFGVQSPQVRLAVYVGHEQYMLLKAYGPRAFVDAASNRVMGMPFTEVDKENHLNVVVELT